jgi:hypothetical protein
MSEAPLKLSTRAIAIYVVLMAEHQSVVTKELATMLGIKDLDSGVLKELKLADLVKVGRSGRSNTYQLSKAGWARSLDVMALPVKAWGSAPSALLALLQALHRGFTNHPSLSPESFFRPSDEAVEETDVEAVEEADVEALVRKAYAALARMPGDWVPLSEIRDRLTGVARGDVDTALESLAMQPGVQLIPWDNRKALTARDHEAALHFGGEDNHNLRIEEV